MKLYHCEDSRSLRPLWTLYEMGLEFDLVTMKFPPRYYFEGYKELNPLGTVPFFVVLAANAVWGLAAAGWLHTTGR